MSLLMNTLRFLSPIQSQLHRFLSNQCCFSSNAADHYIVDCKMLPVSVFGCFKPAVLSKEHKLEAVNRASLFRPLDRLFLECSSNAVNHTLFNLGDILPLPSMEENCEDIPMEFHKRDKYWRKRRMRRHRLLKWRKRLPFYSELLKRREENRKQKRQEDLEKAWTAFGLNEEPPPLTRGEKNRFVREWQEKGTWTDVLSEEELGGFAKITNIRRRTDKP